MFYPFSADLLSLALLQENCGDDDHGGEHQPLVFADSVYAEDLLKISYSQNSDECPPNVATSALESCSADDDHGDDAHDPGHGIGFFRHPDVEHLRDQHVGECVEAALQERRAGRFVERQNDYERTRAEDPDTDLGKLDLLECLPGGGAAAASGFRLLLTVTRHGD